MNRELNNGKSGDYKCILSIDGGGIKGILPLAFLAHIEDNLPNPIGKYFDFISGTSTGGLIAAGLALGKSAKELYDLYLCEGPEVFSDATDYHNSIGWQVAKLLGQLSINKIRVSNKTPEIPKFLVGPKYNSQKLKKIIDRIVSNKKFDEFKTPLLITAWNVHERDSFIYRTFHESRFQENHLIRDALTATTAAPILFPEFITSRGNREIDGAVWANNPTAVTITEALSILNWKPQRLRVLSLGCSDEQYTLGSNTDFLDRVKDASRLFFDGQSKGSLHISDTLLKINEPEKSVFRYSPAVEKNTTGPDIIDEKTIKMLSGKGDSCAKTNFNKLHPIFFTHLAKRFPFYKPFR